MTDLPLFPVTVVGSWPRTRPVQKALRQLLAGKLDRAAFDVIADAAVLEVLAAEEEAGVDIVSDGEQRRDSFFSFIPQHVNGLRLMTLSEMLDYVEDKAAFEQLLQALDVPAFAIKNPVVDGPISLARSLGCDDYAFLRRHTDKAIKIALPGPYLLTRSMWMQQLSAEHYPTKESLGDAVVDLLHGELVRLRDAGCDFVQFDEPVLTEVAFTGPGETHTFMCAALAEKTSPEEELEFSVELINRVVDGVDGIRTGLHICRGNWSQNEKVLLTGAYDPLVPYLARMDVSQFVLEYATDRAGDVGVLADLPEDKEIGLGVVDPRTESLEPVDAIVAKVERLLEHRRPEQVFLNPDCGFGTFAERPVNTHEIAVQKMRRVAEAARVLRDRHAG